MTDRRTFESPAEYTPEEQIEALQRLGAEIMYTHRNALREAVECRVKFTNGLIPLRLYTNATSVDVKVAHEFLRTDLNAWMALDDYLANEIGWWVHSEHTVTGHRYSLWRGNEYVYRSEWVECRQAAVYDCFMQFIREELKKK